MIVFKTYSRAIFLNQRIFAYYENTYAYTTKILKLPRIAI